jgi:hypothetical protein
MVLKATEVVIIIFLVLLNCNVLGIANIIILLEYESISEPSA